MASVVSLSALRAEMKLLEKVIAQLKTLPAEKQDAIAARLLAEMEVRLL